MDTTDFDQEKFFLGVLCTAGHEWQGTGQTLRYASTRKCAECHRRKERDRQHKLTAPKKAQAEKLKQSLQELLIENSVDITVFKLGPLCLRQHDWNGTGYSLRYANRSATCTECSLEHKRQRRRRNPELVRAKDRERMRIFREKNPDYSARMYQRYKATHKRCLARRYQANKAEYNQKSRENYLQNREHYRRIGREYARSPQGKLVKKRSEARRRALKRQARLVPYKTKDLHNHFLKFGNCCVYCGTTENLTADHFIPLIKGGPDCLGNIVPCCCRCNSSKNQADPLIWFQAQPFFQLEKWRNILSLLGKDEQSYTQIPLF
jgi:hypothetical protein